MKSKPSFVWSKSRVKLNTIATIDLYLVFVIFPDDPELDHPLRDGANLKSSLEFGVFLEEGGVFESGVQLCANIMSVDMPIARDGAYNMLVRAKISYGAVHSPL